ncbi:SGNH/GDSL hydrolase family protein [candidate division KSB1 bacterium]
MLKRSFSSLLVLLFLSISCGIISSDEPTYILPSDRRIHYSGRIDQTDPDAPVLYWPGTAIRATFNGTSLKVALDDSSGGNFYNVIIDENDESPVIIGGVPGDTAYSIISGLEDTEHSVTVFRRTEGMYGPTAFKGFILDYGRSLTGPPQKQERLIEFYGNSITCGMGNEAPDDGPDNLVTEENNYLAYGAITARNLNADYVCIAKSGIGIIISWFDFTMPDYYDRLNPRYARGKWDFSRWTPDAVIINLFQNDSWLMNRLDPVPDDTDRIEAYTGFVRTIREKYPDTPIICTLGTMDAIQPGSKWPGYVENAVQKMNDEHNDPNVYSYIFEYQDFTKHPRVRHHGKMADELTVFIRGTLGW